MIQAFHSAVARKRVAGGGNGLLTGLLHWWDLDETSGDAIAQAGGVDLTDTNTVTYTAGGAPDGGNCRLFTRANSERFSASAGSIMNSGTDLSIAIWTNVTNDANNKNFIGHNAPNGYTAIFFGTTEALTFAVDGFSSTGTAAGQTGWHLWVFTSVAYTGSDKIHKDGSAQIGATGTRGWEPGSATFYLGANQTGANYYDGELVSLGIWDRILSADDMDALYNSGVNLRYADLTS
jgi:hypothetical protein